MTIRIHHRLDRFLALDWYETVLRFVATFVSKTSELLLAAGLVVSTANFLTDGTVLNNAQAAVAWPWVQALALDSSLGISFYYVLQCLKKRDWVKFALYIILTGLLTLVAGSITNVEIFSHAIHASMSSALAKLGFDVGLLSTLRAIAVVGFVLLSRLKDVSLKDLYTPEEAGPSSSTPARAQAEGSPPELARTPLSNSPSSPTLTLAEVAHLLHAVASQQRSATGQERSAEVPHSASASGGEATGADQRKNTASSHAEAGPTHLEPSLTSEILLAPRTANAVQSAPVPPAVPQSGVPVEPTPPGAPLAAKAGPVSKERGPSAGPQHRLNLVTESAPAATRRGVIPGAVAPQFQSPEDSPPERDQRLERAYQSLLAEGKKPSGRALAERAHVHRASCVEWLREKQRRATTSRRMEEEESDKESVPGASLRAQALESSAMDEDLHAETGNASPGVPPASPLPEGTPPLQEERHCAAPSWEAA